MRKGFTLVECMLAGTLLCVAALALLQGLGVLSRVAKENAEMLEADAVVWDALAAEFNRPYDKINSATKTRLLTELEAPLLWSNSVGNVRLTVRTAVMPMSNASGSPLKSIAAWVEWGGPESRMTLTNFVYRSDVGRGEPTE